MVNSKPQEDGTDTEAKTKPRAALRAWAGCIVPLQNKTEGKEPI
jgi:hypothetical protein